MKSFGVTVILYSVWQNEKVPSDWKRVVFIRIPKKGNSLRKCLNWRIITQLMVSGKSSNNILHARIKDKAPGCNAQGTDGF